VATGSRPQTPQTPQTAAEFVAARLRMEIQAGDHRPGTRLRQGEIAQRFGVSTTPVREAFALLQADGLLQIDRYRGAVVFRHTVKDLQDSYEIREALETLAIAKAIPNITPEMVEDIQALIDEMRGIADDDRWMELNNEFHLRLYAAADSPRLESVIANQREASSIYIRMRIQNMKRADDQHQEILDACVAHDVKRAQEAVRTHLTQAVGEIADILEDDETAQLAAAAQVTK
jgi:DNA-binding GntR family transcriptional regulator